MHIWAFTPRSPETDCAVPQGKVTWQLRSRLRERGLDLGAVGVNLPQMGADEAVGVHGTYCGCDEIPDKSNLRKDFFFVTHSLRVRSTMVGKAHKQLITQGSEVAGYTTRSRGRGESVCLLTALSFYKNIN